MVGVKFIRLKTMRDLEEREKERRRNEAQSEERMKNTRERDERLSNWYEMKLRKSIKENRHMGTHEVKAEDDRRRM